MKAPAFDYAKPASLPEAFELLQRPNAKILAGGQSLIPSLNMRLSAPELLVDITGLPGLAGISVQGNSIRIGALTTHARIERSEEIKKHVPLLAQAVPHIAHAAIRNRGTIGGSLCQADPGEDLSAVCSAVKAEVVIRGAAGERVVSMDEFHVGPYVTAVGGEEILTEVRIKVRPGAGSAHEKVERRAGDFAIAAASAGIWVDGGTVSEVGVGLAAAGPFTIDVTRIGELLRGQAPTEELFERAGEIAAEDCMPMADTRGPVDYKRHLVGVLTKRALRRATARALQEEA